MHATWVRQDGTETWWGMQSGRMNAALHEAAGFAATIVLSCAIGSWACPLVARIQASPRGQMQPRLDFVGEAMGLSHRGGRRAAIQA
jgi:hypothetical protein